MHPSTIRRASSARTLLAPRALVAIAVAAALVAGAAIGPTVTAVASPTTPAATDRQSFANLVERVKPAVVNISTRTSIAVGQALPLPPGTPFERRFRDFFGQQFGEAPQREARGMGSGFVIDASGYVVTNNHVIDGANEVTVTLQDGKQLPANVVGRDPKTDLALLKVDSDVPLEAVEFGDSDTARVGDWVVAVGNPFGLGGTVTAGIISARGRDIQSGPYDDYLQVDAPINRGNSGGPLFDTSGKVIGVNTAIFSPSGGNVGIGFAIPASLARDVVEALKADGKVNRGWMGVSIQQVSDELAESFGLDKARGALVASVTSGGPAAAAGIRTGDIILSFDGQAIGSMRELPRVVASVAAGKTVDVTVWRDGARKRLSLEVGSLPGEKDAVATLSRDGDEAGIELGVVLAVLDEASRQRLAIDDDTNGVLIARVTPGSAAARTGLRPGDVILRVGTDPVSAPKDVLSAVKQAASKDRTQVVLLVRRDGNDRFVAVPFERG